MAEQRGLTREDDFSAAIASVPPTFEMFFGKGLASEDVREKLSFIFYPIEQALEGLTDALAVLSAFVDLLGTMLDVLSALLGIALDVLEGVILLMKGVLLALKEALTGTSINALFHFPTSVKAKRTPSEILYDVGMSYLDVEDSKRPVATLNAYAATLVAMWSLPDIDKLLSLLDKLKKSFGSFTDLAEIKNGKDPKGTEWKQSSTTGMKPNWDLGGLQLTEFSFIRTIIKRLDQAINGLSTTRPYFERLNSILNAAQLRISRVQAIVQEILSAINSLFALLALGDSNCIFGCKGTGTNKDFATAIINAPLHESYPKAALGEESSLPENGIAMPIDRALGQSFMYTGALALHLQVGAGGSVEIFNALWDTLLGEKLEKEFDEKVQKKENFVASNQRFQDVKSGKIKTGWSQVKGKQKSW